MLRIKERDSPRRCALCHGEDDGELVPCERCHATMHFECFMDGGYRCPTLGCIRKPSMREQIEMDRQVRVIDEQVRNIEIRNGLSARDVLLAASIVTFLFVVAVVWAQFIGIMFR